jgi:hypothetical protein
MQTITLQTHVRLLANNRILCCNDMGISIYEIPPFRQLTVEQIRRHSPNSREPHWTHRANLIGVRIAPQVYFDGVVERVVVWCRSQIVGIAIPLNREKPTLQFTVHTSPFSQKLLFVGLYKAIVRLGTAWESSYYLVSLPWDDGERCSIGSSAAGGWKMGLGHCDSVLFDEQKGRIVFADSPKCRVVDFVFCVK